MIRIALTAGDRDGIGPEVTAKAIRALGALEGVRFTVLGNASALAREGLVPADNVAILAPRIGSAGREAGRSIESAVQMLSDRSAHALVTGPISKERLQKGGYKFMGHTDFLAALANPKNPPKVTMMLANDRLRVALATVHCSLREVSKKLSPSSLGLTIENTIAGLKELFGVAQPRIAVLGLNPHAGENGLLGREEKTVILPTLKRFKKKAALYGPYPADTYFASIDGQLRPDAVVAMYHDQGLIPVKMVDFAKTFNTTLGLPFIRTSVDHGTAFDIAGQGKADPSSMVAAIQAALRMVKTREIRAKHL